MRSFREKKAFFKVAIEAVNPLYLIGEGFEVIVGKKIRNSSVMLSQKKGSFSTRLEKCFFSDFGKAEEKNRKVDENLEKDREKNSY